MLVNSVRLMWVRPMDQIPISEVANNKDLNLFIKNLTWSFQKISCKLKYTFYLTFLDL